MALQHLCFKILTGRKVWGWLALSFVLITGAAVTFTTTKKGKEALNNIFHGHSPVVDGLYFIMVIIAAYYLLWIVIGFVVVHCKSLGVCLPCVPQNVREKVCLCVSFVLKMAFLIVFPILSAFFGGTLKSAQTAAAFVMLVLGLISFLLFVYSYRLHNGLRVLAKRQLQAQQGEVQQGRQIAAAARRLDEQPEGEIAAARDLERGPLEEQPEGEIQEDDPPPPRADQTQPQPPRAGQAPPPPPRQNPGEIEEEHQPPQGGSEERRQGEIPPPPEYFIMTLFRRSPSN